VPTRNDLLDHQRQSVELIKNRRYLALWLRMRQGKTISTLTALQDLYDDLNVHKILVVAPLRVGINSWPEDLRSWDHLSLTHTLIRGSAKQRLEQSYSDTDLHIINRENLAWLVDNRFEDWHYDTVVLDESRSYKNHTKKTPKKNLTRFGAMAKVRPKVRRVIELTGTPAPKNYQDLWAQIYLLDGGKRLGKDITAFRKQYMIPGRAHYMWSFKDGAQDQIRDAISDIAFSIRGVPTPEPQILDIKLEMPAKAKDVYNTMRLKKILAGYQGFDVVAKSPAAVINKLAQICAGAVYHTEKPIMDPLNPVEVAPTRHCLTVHAEKMKALEDIVDISDAPLVIIYQYEFEREAVLAAYPDAVLLDDSPDTVTRWNAGQISKLVMHPSSGGHGLTLWQGGSEILWLSPTHDQELYEQVNERLSSLSKQESTTVYRLLMEDSVEEVMVEALAQKDLDQKELMAYIIERTLGRLSNRAGLRPAS